MLSLVELGRAAEAIEAALCGHRVEKIVAADATSLDLVLYGRAPRDPGDPGDGSDGEDAPARRCLVLSCHPELGRIGLRSRAPRAPEVPPAFAQLARSRLAGARLRAARASASDRQLRLEFETRSDAGETIRFTLLLALTGRRANTYLLTGEDRLLGAQRPFAKTRSELSPGAAWSEPAAGPSVQSEDRFSAWGGLALLEAIEADYAQVQGERDTDELERRLRQAIRKERKHAERRLARVREELAEADQANELGRHGELLKSVVADLRPGQSEARVRDWETGEEVVIPLDPTKSARQNLAATFKRYQKLLRRLTKAGGQLDGSRERLEELNALEGEVERAAAAGDEGASLLSEIAGRETIAALLARHAPPPALSKPVRSKPKGPFAGLAAKLRPRRYRSSDDLEIWVGRSDAGNDHLSTRLARSKDLFFHVEASPGSHVILRTGGRVDPPSESVLEASELAVHFSKMKNAGRCEVHVVPIKNVKKPKGAKAGLVYVTGGKSLHLRREQARLARVLAARIDD